METRAPLELLQTQIEIQQSQEARSQRAQVLGKQIINKLTTKEPQLHKADLKMLSLDAHGAADLNEQPACFFTQPLPPVREEGGADGGQRSTPRAAHSGPTPAAHQPRRARLHGATSRVMLQDRPAHLHIMF